MSWITYITRRMVKMNKRKIGIIVFSVLLIVLYSIRVYAINRNVDVPVTKEYSKGEKVPYENDFSETSNECINGYSVTVKDTEILQANDFYKKYNLTDDNIDYIPNYYYIVKVEFENKDNKSGTESGIDLNYVSLVSLDDYTMIDDQAFLMLNPKMPGVGFSLRTGTTKEMLLPYQMTGDYSSVDDIKKADMKLQITQYPNRKLMSLK